MNTVETFLIFWGIAFMFFAIKKLNFSALLLTLFSGLGALFACDLFMSFWGENMPINVITVSIGAIGGIPAVILMILIKTLLI